jgi:DedD protein
MQPKYTHNKSNIIKITEEAKRKSRQRLIGSIILLGFALFVLLNVTAKVKPIAINPDVVEIKNKAASGTNGTTLMVKNNASASVINASAPVAAQVNNESVDQIAEIAASTPITSKKSASQGTGYKAGVVNRNNTGVTQNQGNSDTPVVIKTPSSVPIKKPKPKAKPSNPEDILNGLVDNSTSQKTNQNQGLGKSYIQFAALKNQSKADQLQQVLASKGINASVQEIETDNGTIYRLRAGPFSREDAVQKLQQITGQGYSGIVTGS